MKKNHPKSEAKADVKLFGYFQVKTIQKTKNIYGTNVIHEYFLHRKENKLAKDK